MFRLILGTGIIVLLSSDLWGANPSQSKLDIQLKSLVRHGSVLIADEQQVLGAAAVHRRFQLPDHLGG